MSATEYPVDGLNISQMITSFTNARTPTPHADTHGSSGSDTILTIDGGTP